MIHNIYILRKKKNNNFLFMTLYTFPTNRRLFKKQEFYLVAQASAEWGKARRKKKRQWIKLIENIERSDTVCFSFYSFHYFLFRASRLIRWKLEKSERSVREGDYNELLMKQPNNIMIYWKNSKWIKL